LLSVDKGDVFGWGNNEYDQLTESASGGDMQLNVARHLELPGVGRVLKAAAAGSACIVINGRKMVLTYCTVLNNDAQYGIDI